MKKLFLAISILTLSLAHASVNAPEKAEVLSAKVILENTTGYYALADGSCWKVIGFSPRWRNLSEWWNNVKLVPQSYECVPNDWFVGTQIEIYSKLGNLNVNLEDASNQDALKQCTHILINSRTGQILFAISLNPADCIVQLSQETRNEGYYKGYTKGRLDNYTNGNDIYHDGYRKGYTEGYKAAIRGEPLDN